MIVTRFAPSPTGFLHIGSARTALFNWLYAKHTGGKFLLRIEDTDQQRSTQEAIDAIINSLEWLGLNWDGDLVMQSDRIDRHRQVAKDMLKSSHAYECYATAEEIASFREQYPHQKFISPWRDGAEPRVGVPPVIRIKAPLSGVSIVNDHVQGSVQIDNSQLDDMVMLRSDGTPTYMLAVVVDDHDMGVNTVIRGDDHFTNAFRQNLIYQATLWPQPSYTHIPLIHGADGNKLSKRHGATAAEDYREMGYLPGAIINYLLRLGWSHGDDEIFTREQFLEWFNLDHLGRSAAQFDEAKLRWVNAQHIKAMAGDKLAPLVADQLAQRGIATDARLPKLCDLLKDRCDTTVVLADWVQRFYAGVQADHAVLEQHVTPAIRPALDALKLRLASCNWDKAGINAAIKEVLAEAAIKMPQLAMPVRVLVLGTPQTPSLDAVLELLDREIVLERLGEA